MRICMVGLLVVCVIALPGLTFNDGAAQNPTVPQIAGHQTVRQFGAVGDGKTDDAAAIQRAVDSGLGSIRFDKGVYRLTKPILIDLDRVGFTSLTGDGTARIIMAGPGPAFRFLGTHAGTAAPNSFKASLATYATMPLSVRTWE